MTIFYPPTIYRSDHKPYGRDFSNQIPTGRFRSGKLLIDFIISRLVQKDLLPPYLNPELATDDELLTGASFGSGVGVVPLTATEANVLDFTAQIDLFDEAVMRIRRLVGEEKAKFIVENGLIFINTGDIDFVNFYTSSVRSSQFNISEYQDFVPKNIEAGIQVMDYHYSDKLMGAFSQFWAGLHSN